VDNKNEVPQLDKELLAEYVQSLGVDVVKCMFALYKQQEAIYINDIEKSLCCDDQNLWQEHCHKMKGASGSVGLKGLHLRLKLMEKTTANIAGKASQLVELKIHSQETMVDFTKWIDSI